MSKNIIDIKVYVLRVLQAPKKSKKKKKRRDPLPGVPTPRRRSTSLQPVLSAALDGSTLYGCPQCHTVFQNREAIEAHLAIHRSERPFICQDCGAALKRKEHLDRHKSSHVTERPHTCPVCNKNFKRQVRLRTRFSRSFSFFFLVFQFAGLVTSNGAIPSRCAMGLFLGLRSTWNRFHSVSRSIRTRRWFLWGHQLRI